MATNKTVRYIKYNHSNSTIHNGPYGVNSDGDGTAFQEPTFQPYDRRSLGSGVAWDIPSQKVTLTQDNPISQTLAVRFTNGATAGTGSPHYGGSDAVSMLVPYRGIPTSRAAAYAQTLAYYVRTFFENSSGSYTFNIEVKLAPGFWNGSPTNINPVTYNFSNINSSGNVFRGEKLIPSRGTLYHSGSEFDFDGFINPSGVSNVGTFNHYGGEDGFGFSDFLPTWTGSTNGGTSFAEITITTTGTNYTTTFYANPILEYDHLQSSRASVIHYQALDIIMDGSDSDHTIPTLATASTLACQPNSIHYFDETNYQTTSSVSEQSVNLKFCPQIDVIGTSTFAITPSVIKGLPATTYTAISDVLVTTANFTLLDNENLTANTTLAVTPSFKPAGIGSLTATTSSTTSAGIKFDITGDYTWDSFNLNTYFEIDYIADDFVNSEGEYTWEFLSSTGWDDWPVISWIGNEQTWENWPDDVWETPYVRNASASMIISPSFKLGDIVTYTGSFSLVEDTAFNQPAVFTATATTSIEVAAKGIIDVSLSITGSFSPTLAVGLKYALDDTPITITGAFSTVMTASAITDIFSDVDTVSTLSITPTFKPSGFATITVATAFDQVPTFKPAGLAELTAFASTLQVARVFYQADPYNTIKVGAETRTVVVPVENRQTLIMRENRLNTVSAETRAYLVPQETRSLKLKIPPMTNKFSTPRVRSNH